MERGKLGIDSRTTTVFVFDGLIAHLQRPRIERLALAAHQWDRAVNTWVFDVKVCDRMRELIDRYQQAVEVLTWRPKPFADVVSDRLLTLRIFVRSVETDTYTAASPRIATDRSVNAVYDIDPFHRHGYGWKCREL